MSKYLTFKVEKGKYNIREKLSLSYDVFQEYYYIKPTHKIIKKLPNDCNKDWTLDTYQKEVINDIDLDIFSFIVWWSENGIIIEDINGNLQFKSPWIMFELLTIKKK